MRTRSNTALLGAALALAVIGGACGGSSDDEAKELNVKGVDYAFEGVPKKVAPGTVVALTNDSKKEVHEIVALRVKDGETRPLSDLLQLPEAEQEKVAEFRGVVVAFPGEKGFAPQGPLTLSQPGRYLLICTIPTGADPVLYREKAKDAKGPVEVPGGPPHVAKGMAVEVTVA